MSYVTLGALAVSRITAISPSTTTAPSTSTALAPISARAIHEQLSPAPASAYLPKSGSPQIEVSSDGKILTSNPQIEVSPADGDVHVTPQGATALPQEPSSSTLPWILGGLGLLGGVYLLSR